VTIFFLFNNKHYKTNWFQVDMGAKENKSCQMEGVSIEPEDELVSCSQSCFMLKIRFFMLM
jgi:hypothetical protein